MACPSPGCSGLLIASKLVIGLSYRSSKRSQKYICKNFFFSALSLFVELIIVLAKAVPNILFSPGAFIRYSKKYDFN